MGDASVLGDGPGDGSAVAHYNRAFVTSGTFSIPFNGLVDADAACQAAADAVSLGGTFRALLGTSTLAPLSRFLSARGWIDTMGNALVDMPVEWTSGDMRRPLRFDEHGTGLPYGEIWLGGAAGTCGDWAATAGNGSIGYTTNPFDEFNVTACNGAYHFACLESAYVTPLAETAATGRFAFVTTATFTPGGGTSAADTICNEAALAAGLPGSYQALLGTSTTDAAARFAPTGMPWITVDGRVFIATPSDLATGSYFQAFLRTDKHQAAGTSPGQWSWIGTAADNCADWTSTTVNGQTGDSSSVDRGQFFSRFGYPCSTARPLVCLQL